MKFLDSIKKYIEENHLLERGDQVIVGVSGGADSVALLLVLNELKEEYALTLRAVHVHHMIRGEEANRDARFTRTLCDRMHIPFELYKRNIPEIAKENGLSEEEAGRNERYRIFEEVRAERAFSRIAVAHHADDQAETILFNMIRGTGLKGITGMAPENGYLIRPMLAVGREEIENYLLEKDQPYCTDRTNLEMDYARNRIRNIILPEMKRINKKAGMHILKLSEDAAGIVNGINMRADEEERVVQYDQSGNQAKLRVEDARKMNSAVFAEVILRVMEQLSGKRKDLSRVHIQAIYDLCEKKSGSSLDLPYQMKALRVFDDLVILQKTEGEVRENNPGKARKTVLSVSGLSSKKDIRSKRVDQKQLEQEKSCILFFEDYIVKLELIDFSGEHDIISWTEEKKTIDYDKLQDGLVLRYPQTADRISIQNGYKRISRLFIDAKVPRIERSSTLLFVDGEECVWAVGLRLSEKYKVEETTRRILAISIEKKN